MYKLQVSIFAQVSFFLSLHNICFIFDCFHPLLNGPPSGYIGGDRADGTSAVVGQLKSRPSILLIVSSAYLIFVTDATDGFRVIFFLAGVNFYRFNAKNWQFTLYFAVITQEIGNLLCILS